MTDDGNYVSVTGVLLASKFVLANNQLSEGNTT